MGSLRIRRKPSGAAKLLGDHMTKNDRSCPSTRGKGFTRRGFIKSVGASTVGLMATTMATPSRAEKKEEVVGPQDRTRITLNINGYDHRVDVEPRWTLLDVLRDVLEFTGTKEGCSRGECGSCTVLIDDVPRYACLNLAVEVQGTRIETIEGLKRGETPGPTQRAFMEEDAFQCGYCTPGQVMAAEGLLRKKPAPDLDEIRLGMSGNLCRCGAYEHIFRAVDNAAKRKKG